MSKKKKIDTKHLVHAICHLNVVPIWSKPGELQAMVSELLYGETCSILEKKNKYWIKIQTSLSDIIGWVQTNQLTLINENNYNNFTENKAIALEISHAAFNDDTTKHVVLGSSLPCHDGISFTMPDGKYVYNGLATPVEGLDWTIELFTKITKRYLFSPELHGGRTPFGIDKAAFVQNIFRCFGITLPGLPHEQFLFGEIIDFIELSNEGDLAFFEDKEGHIHHVGIIIGEKKIIHVYGCVRIDKIDHHGIYNIDLHKYTHKLRIIKRIV